MHEANATATVALTPFERSTLLRTVKSHRQPPAGRRRDRQRDPRPGRRVMSLAGHRRPTRMSVPGRTLIAVVGPCSYLRAALDDARRDGSRLADVWPAAVRVALEAVDDPLERAEWASALTATAASWWASFERLPAPRRERALRLIGADPERTEPAAEVPAGARACAQCDGPIGADRRPHARYCGHTCKRAANGNMATLQRAA